MGPFDHRELTPETELISIKPFGQSSFATLDCWKDLKIRHLLTHTGGVPFRSTPKVFIKERYNNPDYRHSTATAEQTSQYEEQRRHYIDKSFGKSGTINGA